MTKNQYGFVARVMLMEKMREAIATAALSHDERCHCRVCKAALGDEKAFEEILAILSEDARADG